MKPEQTTLPALSRSIIRTVGRDTIQDLAEHGADAGFCGITYYRDTVMYYKRHRADINALVRQTADGFGEEPIFMVAWFRCFAPADDETRESIGRCLFGGRLTDADYLTANALTWFAAEECARQLEGTH